MKHQKSGKPLIITKIEFRPGKDNAARLRRVFDLLLSPPQHGGGTDGTIMTINKNGKRMKPR